MGWIRKTGSMFGRELMYIAGAEHAKRGWEVARRQWHRASKPLCPACGRGRLFPFTEIIDGEEMKFRGCSMCSHYQAIKVAADPGSLQRLRAIADAKAGEFSDAEYNALVRRFQLSSRWLYGFSLSLVLFAIFLLWIGYDAWSFMNVSMVALFMFVRGLIASYRSWQAKERCWFVPGSFKRWLGTGQWLI